MKIDLNFIKEAIEEMQKDFFGNELFPYMAINGGYELPFQSSLGKKIQDKLGKDYWVYTNKNRIDILIKDLKDGKNDSAIEVGHYQLQQNFKGTSKVCSDIEKAEKFHCPVYHIFLLSDVNCIEKSYKIIPKYGSKRKAKFHDYLNAYNQCAKETIEISGASIKYFGFEINYKIFVSGPYLFP